MAHAKARSIILCLFHIPCGHPIKCYCFNMDFSFQLGIFAGVLQLVAYGLYGKQIFQGKSLPNTAAWSVWALLALLGSSSYVVMTADPAKYFLPLASAAATLCTFVYAISAGKFRRMDTLGWFTLLLCILAGLIWWLLRSAVFANIISVGIVAVSFIPIYSSLLKNPSHEMALPWWVWTSAYSLLTLVVILRWDGHYVNLVYPVTMVFLHISVVLLTLHKLK